MKDDPLLNALGKTENPNPNFKLGDRVCKYEPSGAASSSSNNLISNAKRNKFAGTIIQVLPNGIFEVEWDNLPNNETREGKYLFPAE